MQVQIRFEMECYCCINLREILYIVETIQNPGLPHVNFGLSMVHHVPTGNHTGLNILKNQSFYFHGYTKAPSQRFTKKRNSTRPLMLLPKRRQMPTRHAAAAD